MVKKEFDWLDIEEYPFENKYFNINNYKMHYIDEGKGDIILFVHGTPSWSFEYRKLIKALKNNFRCIATDHIGFGLSDKPKHYNYHTINHSISLETFVLKRKLKNITLVVHDFGGPIGLNFALRYPELVKKIVIINSWMWSSKNDPDFIKISKILKSPLLPFLYIYLNFSPRFILPKMIIKHKFSKKRLKQYIKPFKNRSQRYGVLYFAKSLLDDQMWFEELWNKRQIISHKPTLFIWGMKDPVLKPHNLQKFINGFKNSKLVKLEKCGHFPQEEESDRIITEIAQFIKQTHP
ncbi:alpha/beta fold hydrolase [Abyssalbus ytuae]|uniref:Alpha/beta fold hydrolase n=1 Tax=Abyssalbus ytuae TaxID=2926907 RepID=A0A9E6ZKZ0_9FLAO|nr:alpha/beta fold hydrolase [Abyssalbus ytuae]UOB16145.1 alpha/beta fold hydrolase [Abyssalbus ytuae]